MTALLKYFAPEYRNKVYFQVLIVIIITDAGGQIGMQEGDGKQVINKCVPMWY